MKTDYSTSSGQPEGCGHGLDVPAPLCAACGYYSGPAAGAARSGERNATGYRAPAAVASERGNELDYNPFVCCLLLVSLLLAARLLAGVPASAATGLPPGATQAGQVAHLAAAPWPVATTPVSWDVSMALPVSLAGRGRAGPAARAAGWLSGGLGRSVR